MYIYNDSNNCFDVIRNQTLKTLSYTKIITIYCLFDKLICMHSDILLAYIKVYLLDPVFFMSPRSKIGGHIVFVLSVILSFCPPLLNVNLANNFWTVSARALIFHINNSCDKTFPWVPLFFTLWPWPCSWTHFFENFNLLITFEQSVLELWYFTWIFPEIRPFRVYHYFLPCDLDLRV